jgi:hypothetical protein
MRTSILLASLIIASTINEVHDIHMSEVKISLLAITIFIFAMMDILDFFSKKK